MECEWVFAIALYVGMECSQFKNQLKIPHKLNTSFFMKKIEFLSLFSYLMLIPYIV